MSFISAQNISKVFTGSPSPVVALDNVCLDIERGEFIAIMGPSGSGKTTLLSILGAMSTPTSGELVIDGVSVYFLSTEELADFRARHLGFVFQQLYLMPYLTAIENVMLPMLIARERRPIGDIALEALQQVGLQDKPHRLPGELSSGEQARVAIARALVKSPPIILADEPTGNMDQKTGKGILGLFRELNEEGRSIIMVTHNREAAERAQEIIILKDGEIADRIKQ